MINTNFEHESNGHQVLIQMHSLGKGLLRIVFIHDSLELNRI